MVKPTKLIVRLSSGKNNKQAPIPTKMEMMVIALGVIPVGFSNKGKSVTYRSVKSPIQVVLSIP